MAENPFNNKVKEVENLKTNYRSYSKVIEFNNQFFSMLSNEFANPDYQKLYRESSYQEMNNKIGGVVSIGFIPNDNQIGVAGDDDLDEVDNSDKTVLYLQATLQKINQLRQSKFDFKDIVILTRKKIQGTQIANFLTENNVPILSSESLLMSASSDVQAVVSVLRYLKNSLDIASKVHFLYYIAINLPSKPAVHDFILEGKSCTTETDLEIWLQQFGVCISFNNLRKKALYETTESIISALISLEKRTAYLQFFLDLVLEHDLKKQSGLSDFLNYWDLKSPTLSIPSPEGNNAVRIMTIHKSKGLEFPVVIFPFAEESYSHGPKEKMWLDANVDSVGLERVLVNKNKTIESFGADASRVYNQKKQEDLLDDINILYVALTRAEEQLHIISSIKILKNGNLPNNMSSFFIKYLQQKNEFDPNMLYYPMGEPNRLSIPTPSLNSAQLIPQLQNTLQPKNIKIAQLESRMWGSSRLQSIEFGNVVHEILAEIQFKNDVETAVARALENGLLASWQTAEVQKMLHKIVNHPDLSDFFDSKNTVLNEKIIIQKEGQIVKPDRMVVTKNNEVYLLDYKTGVHQNKYTAQLQNYQNAIEKMGYKVRKKALLYVGDEIEIMNL